MSAPRHAGIDIGALAVKVATDGGLAASSAPGGGPAAAVRAALANNPIARAQLCLAVPDQWLTGDPAGVASLEGVRRECANAARAGQLSVVGQLAAICAAAAASAGSEPAQRRYLVCDIGGNGVRAGVFIASAGTVRVAAVHAERGGGWRDFDAAVRAALAGGQAALPAGWHEQATATPERRARAVMVLRDAATGAEDALDTRVYRIAAAGGDISLTARMLINAFEPTRRRLRAAITAVLGGVSPDRTVLAGGLGWLPLAATAAASAAGVGPPGGLGTAATAGDSAGVIAALGADAAARGALLFARDAVRLAPPDGLKPVTVPAHRFRDGLLEEVSVKLPWTEPSAAVSGDPLTISSGELYLSVDGRLHAARLAGLAPGPYLIGLRPTWPGAGILELRPADGGAARIVPLTDLVAR